MWRKHQSVYQDNMKYVRNDIVKPFRVKILRYAKRVREMHELAKQLCINVVVLVTNFVLRFLV